jgi:hypothetical protein
MFKSKTFFNSHIRKAVISFGTLFNNIQIQRKNDDGVTVQIIPVPLSYKVKQKFIARIMEATSFDQGRATFGITMPRMGFEITSLSYDPSRKLSAIQPVRAVTTSDGVQSTFTSTPYNMGMTLTIAAKNQDDGQQIIEQILPYFNPDFNVTITELPSLGIKRNIQFVLDSVEPDTEYEGDFSKRTLVLWDLKFTVKLNFFGYVSRASIIRKVIQNIWIDPGLGEPGHTPTQLSGERITTTPDPEDAEPFGDYTFVQEYDDILGET